MTRPLRALLAVILWSAFVGPGGAAPAASRAKANPVVKRPTEPAGIHDRRLVRATFAGGCFWCMEPPFEILPGVVSVTSGFTGGPEKDPTYEQVSSGGTGHAEAIQILYDPARIGYEKLLDVFWRNVDPTTANRQFCDVGSQYRSAIFYHDEGQRRLAEASLEKLRRSGRIIGKPIATQIVPSSKFYRAEEYHQDYYKKDPEQYKSYRKGCRRDERLNELWGP